jgi:hypothetical protein
MLCFVCDTISHSNGCYNDESNSKQKKGRLEDLDYADDACLLSQSYNDMSETICSVQAETPTAGLKTGPQKRKKLWTN